MTEIHVRRPLYGGGRHLGNAHYYIRKLRRGGYSVRRTGRHFWGAGYNEGTVRFSTWEEVLTFLEQEHISTRTVLEAFRYLPPEEREAWKEEVEETKTFHVPKRKLHPTRQLSLQEVLS